MEHQEIKHCISVRVLHWILAILILGIAFSGIYMEGLEKSPFKFEIYDWHKAFGVLAFFVLAILFLRTTIKPLDKLPDAFSEKEKLLINVVKKGLYLTIFLTILFGFLASSMHPKVDGIWFFGFTIVVNFIEKY